MIQKTHIFYEVTTYWRDEGGSEYHINNDVLKSPTMLIVAETTAKELVQRNNETNSIRRHIITELKTFKSAIGTKKGDSSKCCNYQGCSEELLGQKLCAYHTGIDIGIKQELDNTSECSRTTVPNKTLKKMVKWLAVISGGYGADKDIAQEQLEIMAEDTDLEEFIGSAENYKGLSQYGARNLLYVCARRLV